MALERAAQTILDLVNQAAPRIETLDAPEARRLFKELTPKSEGEQVARVEDRTIPGPHSEIPVRIYWPSAGARTAEPTAETAPTPAMVTFHGGGWVLGDLDGYDPICRSMTNATCCVVVSVDYRLAPEHKFPAAPEDAYASMLWVAKHARGLGADPSRIVVSGDSAGGNLAAVTTLMAKDRGGPPIAFQLLIYPVTNYSFDTASYRENAEGYLLTRPAMEWFWGHYLAKPSDGDSPYVSPLRTPDLSGLPPAMVITAEYDPLRDEGEAYARRLREAGVRCAVHRQNGVFHGFFSFGELLVGARRAHNVAFAAVREALATGE